MEDTDTNNKSFSTEDTTKKSIAAASPPPSGEGNQMNVTALKAFVAFCAVVTVASVAGVIALGVKAANDNNNNSGTVTVVAETPNIVVNTAAQEYATLKPPAGVNPCEGKKPDLPNVQCAIEQIGPQAGANVTAGYQGDLEVDHDPIEDPYWMKGMCPVNVHWHLGAEHLSVGQYDETGTGPVNEFVGDLDRRRSLQGGTRKGFQCKFYDPNDAKFVRPYVWKHCIDMVVGETYEVHWPHSAAGACGTLNQYQTPFYDGVFCVDNVLTDTSQQIGVQAQVFTIVNDEAYYYPDLMRGMIVDGEMGSDIAKYTGSTTGTSRNNEICSQFSPITWQVDRRCHLISASSFDKMCADMKAQRDDMSDDLYAHGSRELVDDSLAADNHQRYLRAAE